MANLTLFRDVVNDSFYNLIFQALAHVENGTDGLECYSSMVPDPTEARLDDMCIKFLDITGTASNALRFDVVAEADIEITGATSFLQQYYIQRHWTPTSIDVEVLTERMGLTVWQEHF